MPSPTPLIPLGLLLASCTSEAATPGGGGSSSDEPVPGTGGTAAEPEPPANAGATGVTSPSADSGSVPSSDASSVDLPPGDGGTLVQRDTARALFSGHSLLDNPMPDWVQSIAESRGDTLEWEEQIVIGGPIRIRTKGDDPNASGFPGYSLGKNRAGDGKDLLAELASPAALGAGAKYDTLLITERNDLLLSIQYENTTGYLQDFHERVVAQNSEAGSLLYQVWPDIDKANPQPWVEYVRQELYAWECVAQSVNDALQALGRRDRIGVIPGASALARLVEHAVAGDLPGIVGATANERVDLVFEDEVHLRPAGTYLLSALHYAALFGKSPVGAAAPAEVPPAAVAALQQLAWDELSQYRATDAPWAHSLGDCRQRIATTVCPAYFTLVGSSTEEADCSSWASSDSPLRAAP